MTYYARNDVNATGATTQFSVPFPFLNRSHIEVTLAGNPVSFTWLTDGLISISPAPSGLVSIRRKTPFATRSVDFNDTASLDASVLNLSAKQLFYFSQELSDRLSSVEEALEDILNDYQDLVNALAALTVRVTALENRTDTNDGDITTITNNVTNITNDITEITNIINDLQDNFGNYYTKTQIDTNIYTKSQVDALLAGLGGGSGGSGIATVLTKADGWRFVNTTTLYIPTATSDLHGVIPDSISLELFNPANMTFPYGRYLAGTFSLGALPSIKAAMETDRTNGTLGPLSVSFAGSTPTASYIEQVGGTTITENIPVSANPTAGYGGLKEQSGTLDQETQFTYVLENPAPGSFNLVETVGTIDKGIKLPGPGGYYIYGNPSAQTYWNKAAYRYIVNYTTI